MKSYWFYGASDDLVEVEGAEREEYTCPSSDRGTFSLVTPAGDGVNVHLTYEHTGCWSVAVSPVAGVEEDRKVPADWRFVLIGQGGNGTAPKYSAVLEAHVSDDAVLTWHGAEVPS